MCKRQKTPFLFFCITLSVGTGLFLSFSAFAGETQENIQRKTGCSLDSAAASPLARSAPGFLPPAQSFGTVSQTAVKGGPVTLQTTAALSGLTSPSSVSPLQFETTAGPGGGKAVFQPQLPNLSSVPNAPTIINSQPGFIQAALEPVNPVPGIQNTGPVDPLVVNQPREIKSIGSIVPLPGLIESPATTPAHSVANVLSLPSGAAISHSEGNILVKIDNAEDTINPAKSGEAKIEIDSATLNRISVKAENQVQSTRKPAKTLIKEHIAAGKAVYEEYRILSRKFAARAFQQGVDLAESFKTCLVDFKKSLKDNYMVLNRAAEENKEKAKKVLPVLKQFVLNLFSTSKPVNDTDDTVFFSYPAQAIPHKDPLGPLPESTAARATQKKDDLNGFIFVRKNLLDQGTVSRNTQFIDYLKPINDHLIQNGLSPPCRLLKLCFRISSLRINRFYFSRTALALGKLFLAYQVLFFYSFFIPCFFFRTYSLFDFSCLRGIPTNRWLSVFFIFRALARTKEG